MHWRRGFGFLVAAAPFAAGAWTMMQARPGGLVDFNADVMIPIKARCGSCHTGPNAAGGLDLSTPEGLQKGGVSGKAVVPRNPGQSILIRRLKGLDGKPQMPMGFAPLERAQIERIERWISSGAEYSEAKPHWAYVAPKRPIPPTVTVRAWVRNPIDSFILARLEKEGLKPSPEASKEVLLRRVYLDLIGLPPTLEEMDAFLTDKSPNAYEKVVDRLLQSPHYGERQARIWLDLARYADTHGFESDGNRVMWKWRDWVIDAYNRNIPFDQFTIEQLAGDMLPDATIAQRIATGFHRNTMMNLEGGVDKNEAYFEVKLDRVATTGTVWLGQTLACARCHDHKYDPFSQKEFYSLYAVWNNSVAVSKGDPKFGADKLYEPEIPAPTPAQAREIEKLEAEVRALEVKYRANPPEYLADLQAWKTSLRDADLWRAPPNLRAEAREAKLERQDDGSFLATGKVPAHDQYTLTFKTDAAIRGLRLEVLPDKSLRQNGPGRSSSGNFILSKIELDADGAPVELAKFAATYIQGGYGVNGFADDNGDSGWAVYPEAGKPQELGIQLAKPVSGELKLTLTFNSPSWPEHVLGRFRLGITETADAISAIASPIIREAAKAEKPSEAQLKLLDDTFRGISPRWAPIREPFLQAQQRLAQARAQVPNALVMEEKPGEGPLTAPIHHRGEFLSPGELVMAGTPAVLPPLPEGSKANRLALAKWLVDPKNPLTARVQVNRMWEAYFGRGIVETSDNFGTQGSLPSHPELLDWFATEFVRLRWDMKAMHRLIVTSATYRQSSNATRALIERDPANELLARGPRFRMEAEMIRDTALTASGLLSRKVGGPSVFPHQPDGVWNSPYNGAKWNTSTGEDLYRRGLYTFWKRTSPYPSFMALDAPSREVCTAKRERTNTPLQALALMNDEAFIEAARALAKKAMAAPSLEQKIETAFRSATSRVPTSAERNRLRNLLESLSAKYGQDPETAKKLGGNPEEAAWTLVAMTILNLDETITKG